MTTLPHTDLANALRFLAIDGVEKANSGHPGLPMGMADVATVLFTRFLTVDPAQPDWANRDRFVLSAGHGSMLLYALSYLMGYKGLTLDDLKNFRQLGSRTPGHPEHDVAIGIETTPGPLGQGIATAVGLALGERMMNARHPDLISHYTYVIASDGDMMEGISHEAASLAGHLGLSKMIVLYDDNQICIDGPTSLSFSDDTAKRFEAYGWATEKVDGHDPEAIAAAIARAQKSDKPSLIACRTTIGYGSPNRAGTSGVHGSPLGAEEMAATRAKLGWTAEAFETPAPLLKAWREFGARHTATRQLWQQKLEQSPNKAAFLALLSGEVPAAALAAVEALKKETSEKQPKTATRQSSGTVLGALMPNMPSLIGGSADLTPSNNTRTKDLVSLSRSDFSGRYIHWGIREHAMGAAMNGLALYGFTPYAGTFLTFADYCRPAIRLAALMHQRAIYVFTHDSIGLGEDGPTHQPVEHLASLRVIPNTLVLRPADTVETAECWLSALEHSGPSILALSRQGLPTLRTTHTSENLSAKGGYVLAEAEGERHITLIATGSEVSLAMAARAELASKGVRAAVVSLPSFELFAAQPDDYRQKVLGTAPRIGIEAALKQGWQDVLGADGAFIGMTGFGASAPAEKLYPHFGITVENVVKSALKLV